MISHKYKCIFIHITKCAGTSVEHALGVDTDKYQTPNYDKLFGWCREYQIWLQHATPQQLLNLGFISKKEWESYYKFIIYRNSWARSYSDYLYLMDRFEIKDSFFNYLNIQGEFYEMLNKNGKEQYVGEHLYLQKPYFFLDGKRIKYNREINFDHLKTGLDEVSQDLEFDVNFNSIHLNKGTGQDGKHYSLFYDRNKRKLVEKKYCQDIEFFSFKFDDQKSINQKIKNNFF